MDLKLNHEHKREVVGRLKARAKDGSERWIEECIPFSRTRTDDGNWSEWTEGPRQFWCDGVYCNRTSETEFVPLMTQDLLVLEDAAKS